ncbi:hypothetical protein VPH219E481_0041 [Vibrio phage 219E48-1]|nr:hypothetical protein PODOV021v1_p0029 [Vibrio phage 219E41.2]
MKLKSLIVSCLRKADASPDEIEAMDWIVLAKKLESERWQAVKKAKYKKNA